MAVDERNARSAILSSTLELLRGSDGRAPSLAAIAAHAGYSRQAIYRHFGSKAGLFEVSLAEVDRAGGAEHAVMRILAGTADRNESLEGLIAWWVEYVATFIGLARVVQSARRTDPDLNLAWDARMNARDEVIEAMIRRFYDDPGFEPSVDRSEAAEILAALLSIPLWDELINDRGWSRAQYRDRILHLARSALPAAGA